MRRTIITAMVAALMLAALPAEANSPYLAADLAAANEVGGGDGTATGSADIALRPGLNRICFRISTDGLTTGAAAAHIHEGAAGVNGPVVVDFNWAANGSDADGKGCVPADAELIRAIHANPAGYYVNVHNPTVPSGAVRGQLTH